MVRYSILFDYILQSDSRARTLFYISYLPRGEPVFLVLHKADPMSLVFCEANLARPSSLCWNLSLSSRCSSSRCCLPYKSLIPSLALLTPLTLPNILPLFVGSGKSLRCFIMVNLSFLAPLGTLDQLCFVAAKLSLYNPLALGIQWI